MRILAIETSCDETAVAVVSSGPTVEISLVSSQIHLHRPFGGVVPEVASRAHQEWLPNMVADALRETGRTRDDFDAVAATRGPGLIGALLVGVSFAKSLALAWGKPWLGVNHLEGHLASLDLCEPPFNPPYTALLVSGGHTEYVNVDERWQASYLGGTLDDAAGEAFDKVAAILDLGYPGGPVIEKSAAGWNGDLHPFPEPMRGRPGCDVSFSGLKTAVALAVDQSANGDLNAARFAASFQKAAVDALVRKLEVAAEMLGRTRIALCGGVAANQALRDASEKLARKRGWDLGVCPKKYCGDNAAMIGAAALRAVDREGWSTSLVDADPRLSLAGDAN